MAEKTKDAEDKLLETMFLAEPIEDAGFSIRIVSRIRRGIWLRRVTLPFAMLLGAAIAIKPLLQVGSIAKTMSGFMPGISLTLPDSMLMQLPGLLAVGCLMLIGIVMFQLSEE